jgi:hypothetical protein
MARVEVPITVLNSSTGLPVNGAAVAITHRSTGNPATWYSAETGGTSSTASVVTDANGRLSAWVERGSYNLAVTGTGITPYTEAWDAVPASDGSIDSPWLSDNLGTLLGLDSAGANRSHYSYNSGVVSHSGTINTVLDSANDIVVPDGALLFIIYRALVKESVLGCANFTITVGPTNITGGTFSGAGTNAGRFITKSAGINANNGTTTVPDLYRRMYVEHMESGSGGGGLMIDAGGHTGDASFGTGGSGGNFAYSPLILEVTTPGTYDIEVLASVDSASGQTVSAKERKLWVWTRGF